MRRQHRCTLCDVDVYVQENQRGASVEVYIALRPELLRHMMQLHRMTGVVRQIVVSIFSCSHLEVTHCNQSVSFGVPHALYVRRPALETPCTSACAKHASHSPRCCHSNVLAKMQSITTNEILNTSISFWFVTSANTGRAMPFGRYDNTSTRNSTAVVTPISPNTRYCKNILQRLHSLNKARKLTN